VEELSAIAAVGLVAAVLYAVLMIIFPLYVMQKLGRLVDIASRIDRNHPAAPFKHGKPDETQGF